MMTDKLKLTPYQRKAISKIENQIKDTWFGSKMLGYLGIKRPAYICEILERKGKLKSVINDAYKPVTIESIELGTLIGDFRLYSLIEQPNNSLGVNCPGCGVEITVSNAGGYRTYCEGCVDEVEG